MTPSEERLLSTISDLDGVFMLYCEGSRGMAELTAQINETIRVGREVLEQVP